MKHLRAADHRARWSSFLSSIMARLRTGDSLLGYIFHDRYRDRVADDARPARHPISPEWPWGPCPIDTDDRDRRPPKAPWDINLCKLRRSLGQSISRPARHMTKMIQHHRMSGLSLIVRANLPTSSMMRMIQKRLPNKAAITIENAVLTLPREDKEKRGEKKNGKRGKREISLWLVTRWARSVESMTWTSSKNALRIEQSAI